MRNSPFIQSRATLDGNEQIFYPVVILGAGPSGLAAGCRLKQKLGFDQFRIFDRQSGIGGTWWSNKYPGVACDVPAFLYSFSFAPDYLSRTIFSSGRDYVNYLYRVVERFGILDKIQLNADISSIEWIEHDMEWEIRFRDCSRKSRDTPDKEDFLTNEPLQAIRAKVVINAMGILTEPNEWPPDVRGRETFLGEVIHSAQWPADVDFENKHVVLVGSGCSATQIAPALLKSNIKTLLHVIRSPPWVVPRIEEPGGKDLYAQWAPRIYGAMPVLGSIIRILLCWLSELLWFLSFKQPSILRAQAECSSLAHMRKLAPKEYHDILKPSYSLGCKRRVFDNEWLRGMNDPRFTLTNKRLVSVKGREVILQSRQSDKDSHESSTQEYPADVVVLATGFKADRFFNHVSMIGRRGISIHGLWLTRGSPHAYMGTSVDGFPNLFLIMGPNTFVGHTSVMLSIENSIEYTLRLIKPILFDNVETMEPTSLAVRTWLEDVRKDMKRTIFDNCHSWYNGNGDENSIMYPRSQLDFYLRCRFVKWRDWHRITVEPRRRREICGTYVYSLTYVIIILIAITLL